MDADAEHLGPHEHAVVRLDIAIEPGKVTILMDSPLDNLIGFEHAPRNADEERLAASAISTLKDATMFRIDPAAQCRPGAIELTSAALKLGKPDPDDAAAGHADIDASFEFVCAHAADARFVDVDLFGAYTRIQRIDVQAATTHGQFKRTLTRPNRRIDVPS